MFNSFFTAGQYAHPTIKLLFVEQASCLFLRIVQDVRFNIMSGSTTIVK